MLRDMKTVKQHLYRASNRTGRGKHPRRQTSRHDLQEGIRDYCSMGVDLERKKPISQALSSAHRPLCGY